MAESTAAAPDAAPPSQVYTVAILLSLFSLLLALLILPPLFWHFRNRNVGATSLVAWAIVLLLFTCINAIIWPSDNTATWFSGLGLCDVEVRITIASEVALPASFAAVLRGLAAVLDTDHATLMQTKAQKRRNLIIDLLICAGAPLLQIVFYEFLHFRRYAISGISGCTVVLSDSWLKLLLLAGPPLLWTLVDTAYALLILTRLYRYRLTFNSILATSNTTKSRFLRLYLICVLWILGFVPVMLATIAQNAPSAHEAFSWSDTHDYAAYHDIFLVPSGGSVLWDRWVWLATGFCVFVFFGCGREALGMYRAALLAIGLGKVFPALRRDPMQLRPTASTMSSISSKAKMLFKRKDSTTISQTTWTSRTSTTASRSYSTADEPSSPQNPTFLASIQEVPTPSDSNLEKGTPAPAPPSLLSRVRSFFRQAPFSPRKRSSAPVPLAELAGPTPTVRSTVSAGQRPASLVRHVRDASADVLVRKEVRQGSVHE